MTNNKLTDERLMQIADAAEAVLSALAGTNDDVHTESDDMLRLWDELNDDWATPEVVRDMAIEIQERRKADNQEPAPERERIRREHAEWSDATFGNVGPIGPLKHLSKEALEAAADPSDPLEWADMQFLLWDAQRRMGLSDEFITRVMIEKLEINKTRQWPEPKDGEPRLHIKEQPMPVVPDGWVMVPKEPTRQMMVQGHFAMKGTDRGKFRRIYQAMITAASALNKGGINAE